MDTGIVVAFAGSKIPDGWEICDGRAVPKDHPKYRALFEAIGTIHGGDARPLFQLPDYRGRFLRGVDNHAGRDPDASERSAPGIGNTGTPGDAVGSVQDDALGSHSHTTNGYYEQASGGEGFDGAGFDSNSSAKDHDPKTRPYSSNSTGGHETRPRNANVNYIIKL